MIPNFTDHAANERTFLAWVRTAIAVMAFGFLVARFNLFLKIAAQSMAMGGARAVVVRAEGFADVAGLVVIAAGTVMVIVAAVRFLRTRWGIDRPETQRIGAEADLMLAALLVILGVTLVVYLSGPLRVAAL